MHVKTWMVNMDPITKPPNCFCRQFMFLRFSEDNVMKPRNENVL